MSPAGSGSSCSFVTMGRSSHAGSIFRSPCMEDQEPQLGLAVDDLAQHLFAKRCRSNAGPRSATPPARGGSALPEILQQVARAQTDQHAVEPGERTLRRFEAEQIEQQAKIFERMQAEHVQPRLQLARDLGSRLPPP